MNTRYTVTLNSMSIKTFLFRFKDKFSPKPRLQRASVLLAYAIISLPGEGAGARNPRLKSRSRQEYLS
jgi:hypothetical protein